MFSAIKNSVAVLVFAEATGLVGSLAADTLEVYVKGLGMGKVIFQLRELLFQRGH